jgi:hypothetical protein
MNAAVVAAGFGEEPFVKDFLAAFRLALSARPVYAHAHAPQLEVAQMSSLRSLGRAVWGLWRQQDQLRSIAQAQALLAVRRNARLGAQSLVWRKTPALFGWFEKLKALLASERNFCLNIETVDDLATVMAAYRHHRALVAKFEEAAAAYPNGPWCVGAAFFPWLDDAVPIYAALQRELAFAKSETRV